MFDPWDLIDVALLTAIRDGLPPSATGFPADVVKSVLLAHVAAGRLAPVLPGCDRYRLTVSGYAYLRALTSPSTVKSRKAA